MKDVNGSPGFYNASNYANYSETSSPGDYHLYHDEDDYRDDEYHRRRIEDFVPHTIGEFVVYYIFMVITTGIIQIISVSGIICGIINMVLFKRQGFKDTVNIMLFANSASDFVTSFTGLLERIFNHQLLEGKIERYIPFYVRHPTADLLHQTALYLSFRITALVTIERCLCIALPLKVKNIVTVGSIQVTLIVVSLITFTSWIVGTLGWANEWEIMSKHKAIPGADSMMIVATYLHFLDFFTNWICYGIIIFCTLILIVKLLQKSRWRQKSAATAAEKGSKVGKRDLKVVKMILIVALVFIIGSTPDQLYRLIPHTESFSSSMYYVILNICTFICEGLNASVNILIYYKMSSKYKNAFRVMFGRESVGSQKKTG